jgi:hypothetical protein
MYSIRFKITEKEIVSIQNELLLVKELLNTKIGFFKGYWQILPYFKNQRSAFLFINILHFKKYNSFKFLSYEDFKQKLAV